MTKNAAATVNRLSPSTGQCAVQPLASRSDNGTVFHVFLIARLFALTYETAFRR
jgi:hypothetical protein